MCPFSFFHRLLITSIIFITTLQRADRPSVVLAIHICIDSVLMALFAQTQPLTLKQI